jgi:hypothetical protein
MLGGYDNEKMPLGKLVVKAEADLIQGWQYARQDEGRRFSIST